MSQLSLTPSFPQRPGYGTTGRAITVWANYVEMATSSDMALYRYNISVSPVATGRKLKQIIRQLVDSPELAGVRHDIVSDFKSTLIFRRKLEKKETLINVLYHNENHDEPRDDAPTYTTRVLYTNTLSVGDLVNHLKPTGPSSFLDREPTIQSLNIFLNSYAKTSPNLATIGTSRTVSLTPAETDRDSLGAGLIAIRGFFASVRAATPRLLVNVNVSHGVFYDSGPQDGLMREYMQRNRSMPALASFVRRLRVKTRHLKTKKNKKGENMIRAKTIIRLAAQNDGHGMRHPPRVVAFGAGPKDVMFWMDPAVCKGGSPGGGGKKSKGQGGKPPQPTGGGRYISVSDYFRQSASRIALVTIGKSAANSHAHSTQSRGRSSPPCRQRQHTRKTDVPPRQSLRGASRPKCQHEVEPGADPEDNRVCGPQAVGQCGVNHE